MAVRGACRLLLALLVACVLVHQSSAATVTTGCGELPSTSLCWLYYYKTKGAARYYSSMRWRREEPETHACSGLNSRCVMQDMLRGYLQSACKPLADGQACELDGAAGYCTKGTCRTKQASAFSSAREAAFKTPVRSPSPKATPVAASKPPALTPAPPKAAVPAKVSPKPPVVPIKAPSPKPPVAVKASPKPPLAIKASPKPPVPVKASPKPPLAIKASPKPPVPVKASPKPPVPIKASPKPPVPVKASPKPPVPVKASPKPPVPIKASPKPPVPIKASPKPPVPVKASPKPPVPIKASPKPPVPVKASPKPPVPVKASPKPPVPVKASPKPPVPPKLSPPPPARSPPPKVPAPQPSPPQPVRSPAPQPPPARSPLPAPKPPVPPLPSPRPSPRPSPLPSPKLSPTPSPVPSPPPPKPSPLPSPKPAPLPSPKPSPLPSPKPAPLPSPKPSPLPSPIPSPIPSPVPSPPPPVPPLPYGTMAIDISLSTPGTPVPASFLGTSHEWTRIEDYGRALPGFAAVFRLLGPSPIMRIGGATQDGLTACPGDGVWDTLAALRDAANVRFIIGLPLWSNSSISVAASMIAKAQEKLGAAVISYELGNEPTYWPSSYGGYSTNGTFIPGYPAYMKYWKDTASALAGCPAAAGPPSASAVRLMGPAWSDVFSIRPDALTQFAAGAVTDCSLQELSVHYYSLSRAGDAVPELLQESRIRSGISAFQKLKAAADTTGRQLRVSESNSWVGGGRSNISEVFGAALWTADTAFELAAAGASGLHYHWGLGGTPANGGPAYVGVQTNFYNRDPLRPFASPHIPWYGYMFFMEAVGGGAAGTQMLNSSVYAGSNCAANIKAWPLLGPDGRQLRIALLNKDAAQACTVLLRVPALYKDASLARLLSGPAGMYAKDGVTWAGQSYPYVFTGSLAGTRTTEAVPCFGSSDGQGGLVSVWAVEMPAASGALLVADPLG